MALDIHDELQAGTSVSHGLNLLICTQAVDLDDPVLGFFHRWIEEFAKHFEHVHVICLREGRSELPKNVSVHSLGKESGRSRLKYLARFYRFAWTLRHEYDAVLVHMNQEYALLGGALWKLMRKQVYMWRNHYAGSFLTDIAAALCTKVFCTSKSSYTAKYAKTVLMPVGIDADAFKPAGERKQRSILSLGRIAPSKNIHVILAALKLLKERGVAFTASIYGDALPEDAVYLEEQKRFVAENGLADAVRFYPGVSNRDTPPIYSAHEIFVNASRSGMLDKTIFEAAACETLSLAVSGDWRSLAGSDFALQPDASAIAEKLEKALAMSEKEQEAVRAYLRAVAESHSLIRLASRLRAEMVS